MKKWISAHQPAVFVIMALVVVSIAAGYLMYIRPNNATQAAVPEKAPEEPESTQTPWIVTTVVTETVEVIEIVTVEVTSTPEPEAQPEQEVDECLPGATTKQAQALTGISVQRIDTECSTWVWRGAPEETVLALCPQGWICTWDEIDDIVVVQEGVGQSDFIYAGTFRQVAGFPASDAVHDVCELFGKERDLGMREDLSFQVRFESVPGGVQQCS